MLREVAANFRRSFFKMQQQQREKGYKPESLVIHCSAPISGRAKDVVKAALSGEYMEETFKRPESFNLMHASSFAKIASRDNEARMELQKDLFLKVFHSDEGIDVDRMFHYGSLYRHVLNRAGVAMAERLTSATENEWIEKGYYLRCYLRPKVFTFDALSRDHILFENEEFLAIDKPRGLPSVATADNAIQNACHLAANLIGLEQVWPVHRLDIPTTGVLVLAKSSEACRDLQMTWKNSPVEKAYYFVASPDPDFPNGPPAPLPAPGTVITHYMLASDHESPKSISETMDKERGFTKEASLVLEHWEPLDPQKRFDCLSEGNPQSAVLCKVRLLTGRTHQIRAQFGHLGWPLMGDFMYHKKFDRRGLEEKGFDVFNPNIHLRCSRMAFKFREQDIDITVPSEVR